MVMQKIDPFRELRKLDELLTRLARATAMTTSSDAGRSPLI